MVGWEELIDELPATPDREGTAHGRICSLHRIMPITLFNICTLLWDWSMEPKAWKLELFLAPMVGFRSIISWDSMWQSTDVRPQRDEIEHQPFPNIVATLAFAASFPLRGWHVDHKTSSYYKPRFCPDSAQGSRFNISECSAWSEATIQSLRTSDTARLTCILWSLGSSPSPHYYKYRNGSWP